jgi:hypothetical protein
MIISVKSDLRASFGPARDQGSRPTCLAFAMSDAHAVARADLSPLSSEFAYFHAQRRASRPPSVGATLPAMLSAIREDGQPLETGWPYLTSVPADLTRWTPPATAKPVFRRAGASGTDKIEDIIAALGQGKPVVTLMRLSESFFRIDATAIVDEQPGEKPNFSQRHAVVAVGYGELNGQRVVLMRNSWGLKWGVNGYGWITEKYLQPRVIRLVTLQEDLSVSPGSLAA